MRKIISIEHSINFCPYDLNPNIPVYDNCDGVLIRTEEEVIAFGITNVQSCCETFGYLTSQDNFNDFLSSEILSIHIVGRDLSIIDMGEISEYKYPETMFVNIETTNGLLQLVAYNLHDGSYAHDAFIFSSDISKEEQL